MLSLCPAGSGRCRATGHDNHDAPSPNGRVKAAGGQAGHHPIMPKGPAPAQATAHRGIAVEAGRNRSPMMVAPQTRVWAIASRPGRNGRVAQLRDHLVGDADRRGLAQLDSVAAAARRHKSSVLPGGPEDQLAPPDVRKTAWA